MSTSTNKTSQALFQQQVGTFTTSLEEELTGILDWWVREMTDDEQGGFYGRVDGCNRLHAEADKGIMLHTQLLWTFARAARIKGDPVYRSMADRAWHYIHDYFIDDLEGGVFWMLDFRGEPIQTKKQVYAQAFTIYAFSEYYRLSGNRETLRLSLEIFFLLERYGFDKEKSGYLEAFSREWMAMDGISLGEKENKAAKTMYTHLQVLQAYTNLYRIHRTPVVEQSLRAIILCFLDQFIDPETYHLRLFFDENWNCASNLISFGHDLEVSWLLVDAAEVLGEENLQKKCRHLAVEMAQICHFEGIDEDGGCFYEMVPGQYIDRHKHWWPQAEAVVGFLNAFQIGQQSEMFLAARQSWTFIQQSIKDHEKGEWHAMVSQDQTNTREQDKAGLWKGPCHNARACLEGIRRLSAFI